MPYGCHMTELSPGSCTKVEPTPAPLNCSIVEMRELAAYKLPEASKAKPTGKSNGEVENVEVLPVAGISSIDPVSLAVLEFATKRSPVESKASPIGLFNPV